MMTRNRQRNAPGMRPAQGFLPWRLYLSQYASAGGLLVGLVLLLMSESPFLSPTVRLTLTLSGSFWLLLLLALCNPYEEGRRILRGVLNPLLLLFLLWCALAALNAPYRSAAIVELLRVLDGALVYFIVAFGMRRPQEPLYAVLGLLGMGTALCLYNFLSIGESGGHIGLHVNAFGTHENYGSLVLLLLPMTLAFALSGDVSERVRVAALAATPILAGSLLLSLTRSAWIGCVVSLFALIPLSVRYGTPLKSRPRETGGGWRRFLSASLGSPTFLVAVALVAFVGAGGVASTLSQRVRALTHQRDDDVLGDRLVKWKGAAQMASEKPLTGWGLGSYLVMQARWTHQGDDETEVLTKGTGHQNIAHNFYLQWAADSGGVGVALYIALITAFLLVSFQVLPTVRLDPVSRILLTGSMATVIGASVDAIGSPSYNFHGVSSVLWFFIGVGVAAMRASPRERAAGVPSGRGGVLGTPTRLWLLSLTLGVMAAAVIIGVPMRRWGRVLPLGRFEAFANPAELDSKERENAYIARFTDANGAALSTMPGVVWTIQAGETSDTARLQQSGQVELFIETSTGLHLSVFRLPSSARSKPITVTAQYIDSDGRRYAASVIRGARDARR